MRSLDTPVTEKPPPTLGDRGRPGSAAVLINDATTLTLGAIRHEADESGIPIVLGAEPAPVVGVLLSSVRRLRTSGSLTTAGPLTVRNQPVDGSVAVNDNNKTKINGARPYLHVMAREVAGGRWHVFQISDEPPRISLAESVSSYVEAHRLAARNQRPLHFAGQAWQQMVAAGVAPQTMPEDVTLV